MSSIVHPPLRLTPFEMMAWTDSRVFRSMRCVCCGIKLLYRKYFIPSRRLELGANYIPDNMDFCMMLPSANPSPNLFFPHSLSGSLHFISYFAARGERRVANLCATAGIKLSEYIVTRQVKEVSIITALCSRYLSTQNVRVNELSVGCHFS